MNIISLNKYDNSSFFQPTNNLSNENFNVPSKMIDYSNNKTIQNSYHSKRLQVPKACTNCRKMHSGCDISRPCKRCILNGIEATCFDVPRKKRISKKKQEKERNNIESFEQQSPKSSDINENLQESNKVESMFSWEEALNDVLNSPLQQQSLAIPLYPSNDNINIVNDSIPSHNNNQISEFQNIFSALPTNLDPQNDSNSNNLLKSIPNSEFSIKSQQLDQINYNQANFSFLIQQIQELKNSNKNLEHKLLGMSQELTELRKFKQQQQQPEQKQQIINYPSFSTWHSFSPQLDLAISVWKALPDRHGSNILIECNNKFIEMIGYPIETLRNNFLCCQLIRKSDLCNKNPSSNQREWPKRTQIITAFGLKDVFITISPVTDQHSRPKYYITHILEVSP